MRSVSIIVPVKEINDYIRESVTHVLGMGYEDYEVIILPDVPSQESFPRTRIIPTGKMGPAEKRDLALKEARGEILAFLDDDAYPRRDWLGNAVRHFDDPSVGAVSGPAVTPPDDSFMQRVSGAVFLTALGGGSPERYWPTGGVRDVDDCPSVNLIVRRDVFEAIGGFNTSYWPGEDTKLCLEIIRAGKRIVYDPEVLVWHHRRRGLLKHLKQIGRYGLHRGYFAKMYPATSRRLRYFMPSMFTLFLGTGILLPFAGGRLGLLWAAGLLVYGAALLAAFIEIQLRERNTLVVAVSLYYIVLTHIWYGIRFLQGFLFTRELRSKLEGQA